MRSCWIAALALSACLTFPAAAQAPTAAPIPEPPPLIDEGFEPEVTIRQENGQTYEEYRAQGRLYMVKVTPARGAPYYLVDREGDGVMVRQDVLPELSVPMWVIKRW
jgi:hypothetical protein